MLYRINYKHFLVYAIDYLSLKDITNIQYAVFSAKVANLGKCLNVSKISNLYPTVETVIAYSDSGDKSLMKKMYLDFLEGKDLDNPEEWNPTMGMVYGAFVNPLLKHYDVMIVCDESEDDYVDVLCEFLEKRFGVEAINLNQLFDTGHVGPLYIDRDQIRDRAVDIRRMAAKEQTKTYETSREGRMHLLGMMNKHEMKKRLEGLGFDTRGMTEKEMQEMLIEEWCNELP